MLRLSCYGLQRIHFGRNACSKKKEEIEGEEEKGAETRTECK